MIEFVTVLLGLTWGDVPIEMQAHPQVASIEVRIDGSTLALFESPPWAFVLSLGKQLLPHHLEVLAFAANKEQIGYASQLINHARANYEASLWLNPEDRSRGEVHWTAILDRDPQRIEVDFDGHPLDVDQRGRFSLPPHDLAIPHVLEARLVFTQESAFPGNSVSVRSLQYANREAYAQLSFGGTHGDQVTSALTAVPISVPSDFRFPEKGTVASWFESSGLRPTVFKAGSIEDAQLVVVRELSLDDDWPTLARSFQQRKLPTVVHEGDQVDYVSTRAARDGDDVFPIARVKKRKLKRGLFNVLDTPPSFDGTKHPRRIWDAVAVAGKSAIGGKKVRAIVLLLGNDEGPRRSSSLEPDASTLSFDQVRGYLEAIQVPLFCWEPDSVGRCGGQLAFRGAGGITELLSTLDRTLSDQHIVWLEGNHLPQMISLTDAAPAGVELVR